jgi:transposase
MKGFNVKDTATKEQFVQQRAEGYSFDRIAKEISVSKPTLMKWEGELKKQISEASFIRYMALAEEFQLVKQERIKRLAKLLRRVEAELEKRTFGDIADDKLLAITLTIQEKIAEELSGVSYSEGGIDVDNLFDETRYVID